MLYTAARLGVCQEHPDEQVVFLVVGFETTTPGSVMAVREEGAGASKISDTDSQQDDV